MSRRRNAQASTEEIPSPDSLAPGQLLCVVGQSRGSNVFEVVDTTGQSLLAELPPKYRKSVWVRRGSYIIVTVSEEMAGTKLQGTIDHVIQFDQVKEWKRKGIWPNGFQQEKTAQIEEAPADGVENAETREEAEEHKPPDEE